MNDDRMMWNHTSSVMALMANANRDPKRRPTPFEPADFSPYTDEHKTGSHEVNQEQKELIAQWRVNPSYPSSSG